MATYLMLGTYSLEGLEGISAQRSDRANALVEEHGGTIEAAYALLGDADLAVIVDVPDTQSMIAVSVELSRLLGVSFDTFPAVTVEELDALVG